MFANNADPQPQEPDINQYFTFFKDETPTDVYRQESDFGISDLDVILNESSNFISLDEDLLSKELDRPYMSVDQLLANMYRPRARLHTRIKQAMLPGITEVSRQIMQISSIGYLFWNTSIVGVAKIDTIFNSVPSFIDVTHLDQIEQNHIITEYGVNDAIIDAFVNDKETADLYVELAAVKKSFYESLVKGDVLYNYFKKFQMYKPAIDTNPFYEA